MTDTVRLRARIAAELNRTDLSAEIQREINSALKHYESMRTSWNEVKEANIGVTVAGTRYYSLTADFLQADSVKVKYNDAYIVVNEISWDEIEDKDRQISGSQGIPHDYTIYQRQIRFFPIPNGSYTIELSYQRMELPTSLTGSYSPSITATSTDSHNNRRGGWYDDGEELIRQRAKAAIRINYLKQQVAIQEAASFAGRGQPFLSLLEQSAYNALRDKTNDYISTGKIRPYRI